MSSKLLSICIPTYNRKKFLIENLEIIISQLTPELIEQVEICVVDNASTDGTDQYLAGVKEKNPGIAFSYKINPKNLGPDQNFKLAMKMGQGKFGWLFGSDDALVEGALVEVIKLIKENPEAGLMTFNRIDCDVNLKRIRERYWLNKTIGKQVFDFSDKYQEGSYYAFANDVGAVFSFISSTIYRTDAVSLFEYDESYEGTSYSFLYYFINYLKTGIKVVYEPAHYVLCRLGNSHLKGISWPKRLAMDYDLFIKVKNETFKADDQNGVLFLNLLKKSHPYYRVLSLYCATTNSEWDNNFVPKLLQCGWSKEELNGIRRIGNSPNFYQSRFKQKFKNIRNLFSSLKNDH
ncbi:glycosyltransferase family 2 protein [Mucilaginibacter celer]|uniref:Glycosyltransferase n=1 Tax=Mucilaginibacter celer TaxID=2305508 RepID=A0A494W1G5_9SPHI|nr:glycosyltransferase family 2 protein [Mucilaginibacter celer]AYL97122.1 glycosyltransferase [Mucilaginibacter celer]